MGTSTRIFVSNRIIHQPKTFMALANLTDLLITENVTFATSATKMYSY